MLKSGLAAWEYVKLIQLTEEMDDAKLKRQVEKVQANQTRAAIRLSKDADRNKLLKSSGLDD